MTHLIPANDSAEHTRTGCKCEPVTDGGLVIHNSFDNRELDEARGYVAEGKNWKLINENELRNN